MLADDQVLAALADMGAGLLQIEHRPLVALRQHARDAGGGFLGGRQLLPAQAVERFLGLADRRQRAAETAVAQLGRQRLGRVSRSDSSRMVRMACSVLARSSSSKGTSTRRLAADVVEDAARHRHAELLFEQQPLGADLDGVVVPERGRPLSAGRAAAALVFDGIDRTVLLLDQVELAR